jgi:hypothetical protein
MYQIGILSLCRLMLATGGPALWPSAVPWPLHRALAELASATASSDSALPIIAFRPSSDVGMKADGVDEAISELVADGTLRWERIGGVDVWSVVQSDLDSARRDLMRLEPADAAAVHRAGVRWAALAETSLKRLRTASESSGATVRSGNPAKRLKLVAPGLA